MRVWIWTTFLIMSFSSVLGMVVGELKVCLVWGAISCAIGGGAWLFFRLARTT